jgi:hypothetical protein
LTKTVSFSRLTVQWPRKSATEVSPLSETRRTGRWTTAAIWATSELLPVPLGPYRKTRSLCSMASATSRAASVQTNVGIGLGDQRMIHAVAGGHRAAGHRAS